MLRLIAWHHAAAIKVALISTYVGSACASTANSAATTKKMQRAIFRKAFPFNAMYGIYALEYESVAVWYLFALYIRPDHTPRPNCRECR